MLKLKGFSSILCGLAIREKDIRCVRSAIEDLAFMIRSSRESDAKKVEDGDAVLSTTLLKHSRCGQAQEQRIEM